MDTLSILWLNPKPGAVNDATRPKGAGGVQIAEDSRRLLAGRMVLAQ
jgi:hypothetical protein